MTRDKAFQDQVQFCLVYEHFRTHLDEAVGISEFVIAVNLDVRGFSRFSLAVESGEAALYIKSVYKRVLNDYFPRAKFTKPTGDGLLLVIPYTEKDLVERLSETLEAALKVVDEFPTITSGNAMINFEVPRHVGIGISRGAACKLQAGDLTLDYSGKVLNHASRLMDVARPAGVVFDKALGNHLLPDKLLGRFDPADIYLRGIAEEKPVTIYYTKELTKISRAQQTPLSKPVWKTEEHKLEPSNLRLATWKETVLESEPSAPEMLVVKLSYQVPGSNSRRPVDMVYELDAGVHYKYYEEAGASKIDLNNRSIADLLEKRKAILSAPVSVSYHYPIRP